MSNPTKDILESCKTGFTAGKKVRITLCILAYLLSPIDLIPEPLLPFGVMDDLFAIFLMLRVLLAPTLPTTHAPAGLAKPDAKGRVTR